ncbi:MAG: hypothetical protein M1840_007587 [Geoglossum simile]|nr:MAG: hypothetical protein M1840_007587 [Geoglossum simile]
MPDMIAREEAFQALRQREHDAGRPYARTANPPGAKAYQRFVVRRSFFEWSVGIFSQTPIKEWAGDPACEILRSAGFLTVPHNNPLLLAVTPLYLRLLELYQKPIPPVAVLCGEGGGSGGNDGKGGDKDGDTSSGSKDELQKDNLNTIFRPSTSTLPRSRPDHSQFRYTQANTKSSGTHKRSTPLRLPTPTTSELSARRHKRRRRLNNKLSHREPGRSRDDIMFGPHWTSEGIASLWRVYGAPVEQE